MKCHNEMLCRELSDWHCVNMMSYHKVHDAWRCQNGTLALSGSMTCCHSVSMKAPVLMQNVVSFVHFIMT